MPPAASPRPTPIAGGYFSGWLAPPRTANSPHQYACADFNSDGQPDLAEASQLRVSVYLQDRGQFPRSYEVALGINNVQQILSGDVNADGRADLIAYHGSASRLLLNSGVGFAVSSLDLAGSQIVSGHLNGDGRLDLVAVRDDTVSVALGDGTGNFTTSTFSAGGMTGTPAAALADLNADGLLDLVVADGNSALTARFLGLGNGSFGAPSTFNRSGKSLGLVLADLNGDARVDLASQDENRVVWLPGDGSGGFGAPWWASSGGAGPRPGGSGP